MKYQILLSNNPTDSERFAAGELAYFIKQATGEELLITTEISGDKYLSLGNTALFEKSGEVLLKEKLGTDGVRVFTKDGHAFINALSESGKIYATYEFLKAQFGFETYAPDEIYFKKTDDFVLKDMDITSKPDFDGRDVHNFSVFHDPVYSLRLRANGVRTFFEKEHGEGSVWSKLYWCHTTFMLLPPDKYAENHPEWYTENKLQLCLATALEDTDEGRGMYATFLDNFKQAIAAEPTAKYFIVGQEDVGYACEREKSKALYKKYGGEKEASSSVLILFINRVAKDIKAWLKETDEKRADYVKIVVFAYQKTQQPPVTKRKDTGEYVFAPEVKPEENVIVRFAPLASVYSKDFLDEEYNAPSRESILGWSALGAKLSVWNYDVGFGAYEYPLYNWHVIEENYRIFKLYGVEDVLVQGPCDSGATPFLAMRNYVHAKLLWDTSLSLDMLVRDFMAHYFKDAAKYLYQYYELTNAHFKQMEITKSYLAFAGPWESTDVAIPKYYPRSFLDESLKLFKKAKAAAMKITDEKTREQVLRRVRTEELSPRFMLFDLYRRDFDKKELDGMIKEFVCDAKELGLNKFKEGKETCLIEARAEQWQDAVKFGTPVEWYTPLQ